MEKRQAELEHLMLEYEKECLSDLQKAYTEALADVKRTLKGLLASDQTQSIVYQVQYQENLQKQIETALARLKSGSITSVDDFLNKTYEDSYLGTIYSIQGQGIPVNIGIDHEQMARTIHRRTDTMQFSQRLYDNVDRLGVAFKSQMSRGIANNSTYSKIAKQLALESEANYKQAMRIVRTEGGRVKSEAKLNSMQKAKDEGADIVKQWDATFDSKTRAEHRFLDGQIKEIGEPFVDSQGREAQAPHKFGIAEMDVNCRCIVVERARWAVEGEEMPNKVDNETGELVEAKNYKEWKNKYQKQQAEQKQTPSNAKVFDKNSKSLPNKDDYFKTTSGELVKIKEVNDYNGIKSVTLENGQTIVLNNLREIKLSAENMPKAFTDSKRTTTQTQKLVEYVNGINGSDQNAKEILANLGKLDSYDKNGINFKIVYGTDSSLSKRFKYNGEAIDATLNIPKLDGDDIKGAANTTLHELGHLVDSYIGTTSKEFGAVTETNKKLIEAVKEGVQEPNEEVMALFKQSKIDYDDIVKTIDVKGQLSNINKIYNDGGFTSYKDYSKAFNQTRKQSLARKDYLVRNRLNGINNLQDIYDALSGGKWQDEGIITFGHGTRYYNSAFRTSKKSSEIFANYFSLSITRPDLIEVLRRDKPKLVEALDEILEEVVRGLR